MSMDICKCGELVDTDDFPEAYLRDGIGSKNYQCYCSSCRENMIQNLTEEDWEKLQP